MNETYDFDADPDGLDPTPAGAGVGASMSAAVTAAMEGTDVEALVHAAARSVVQKYVSQIAKEALEAALTPERLEQLRERTEQAVEAAFSGDAADAAAELGEEEPELFYGSCDEFVRKQLRFKYRRAITVPGRGTFRWHAAWWKSEEALSRIEALWRAWEKARQDPAAMSDWWLTHCDRQMSVLLSADGPFAGSEETTKPGAPLPYSPPPDGYFAPDKQDDALV